MISNEGSVRLNKMIETMSEKNAKFENYLSVHRLSHKTNLTLPSFRPEVSLCDDDESFFSLEYDVVVDTLLANPAKVIDTPLTPLPLVALSLVNTTSDTTKGSLTLPISPIPLAQCIGLKVDDPFR